MKGYTDYSTFLSRIFPGVKVQKLTIDAGHNCPNRDGTLGVGGCIYCNNNAFSPAYCHKSGSVTTQIANGRQFFAHKYPNMKFMAYFQAYTSTHAPVSELKKAYEEAMSCPDIYGLVIGTRPDCMPDELLDYLTEVNASRMPVIVEYGVETIHNDTLRLINRHHSAECAKQAVFRTAKRGIAVGIHLIMGLPGETRSQMLQTVTEVSHWPVSILKFHQLQVVKGTPLYAIWKAQQEANISANNKSGDKYKFGDIDSSSFPVIKTFELEEYLSLCTEIVGLIPSAIAIERFTAQCPPSLLAAPCWHVKNYQFTTMLQARLRECL